MIVVNFLIEFVVYFLVELIGYGVARVLFPLLSFGRIVVQPLVALELSAFRTEFNHFGYRRDRTGRIEISSGVAGSLGLLISFFIAAVVASLVA